MEVKEQLSKLKPYAPGKTTGEVMREYGLDKIIKLASNENPYGSSEQIREAILSIESFGIYPDGAARELRRTVADFQGVDPEQLIFSSGLDELIQIISRAMLSEGTNTVMSTETFPQYRHHAIIENAEVREVPHKNGYHDLPEMAKQIDEKTKIVWICNPNNPTGTYVNKRELEDFLQAVPENVLVVLDEAYHEYAMAEDYPETIPLLDKYKNLLVLRTFSKAYGLAAFRIGYGVGDSSFIQKLEVVRLPFNSNALAQKAAIVALKDQQFVEKSVSQNEIELQKLVQFCERHNIDYYPSQTNFIFLKMSGEESAKLFQSLLENGIIVRPFPNGVRITIGTKEENDELLNVLEEKIHVTK